MNFTNELLETMTIYKLRDFAREMGVKAPTTKRRSQIIEELNLIKEGKLEPCFPHKKVGRPVRSQSLLSDVEQKVEPNANVEDLNKEFDVEGFVHINNANEFIVYNYENQNALHPVAWIPNRVVDRKRVKQGDFISIKAVRTADSNVPVCVSIFEVNEQTYKGLRREDYDTKPLCDEKVHYLRFGNFDIAFCDRVLFSGNAFDYTSYLLNLLNQSYDFRQSIVLLDVNCSQQKFEFLKKFKNIKLFCCSPSDSIETQNACQKLAVSHCKRMSELGKRAVLIVADLDNTLNRTEINERFEISKQLFGLARNFNIGSLTVFATISQHCFDENIFLSTLVDGHIKLIENVSYQSQYFKN